MTEYTKILTKIVQIILKKAYHNNKKNNEIYNDTKEMNYETYDTKYGKISLYNNESIIGGAFKYGGYWEEEEMKSLAEYIPKDKNILEIGAHCGTSTIFYSRLIKDDCKMYVYEPQRKMYNLLTHNIEQNQLQNKIYPVNSGVFCYKGTAKMNNFDIDGCGQYLDVVEKNNIMCNYGGIALGNNGEQINVTTIDDMNLENIGFIHSDAQGCENYIFSKGLETIKKYRPVIFYEDCYSYYRILYDQVTSTYPQYNEESKFDIKKYCLETLGYRTCIDRFCGSMNNLLIP